MRLVCGAPVRLPRTDAPLTSGYPYAWEPPVSDTVYRWDCTVQWLRSNPPYLYTKQPAPVVRAALPRHVGCRALRAAWRLCSAVPVQQSPRSAGPMQHSLSSSCGPWRRRGGVVPNNCETRASAASLFDSPHFARNLSSKPSRYRHPTPAWVCVFSTKENTNPSAGGPRSTNRKAATWLILPVVICLSQRLSHACLSISIYTAKLQTAH